jgi:hypothetical protein
MPPSETLLLESTAPERDVVPFAPSVIVLVRLLMWRARGRRRDERGIAIARATVMPDCEHQNRLISVDDDEARVQRPVRRLQDDPGRGRRGSAQPFESPGGFRTRTANDAFEKIEDRDA